MLVTLMSVTILGRWWQNFDDGDIFGMLDANVIKVVDVGDQNGQNRHQHLIVVTNTIRLEHPSPTSM